MDGRAALPEADGARDAGRPIAPRGARRIVFVGNCQADALAKIYRRFVAGPDDAVAHVASYARLDESGRALIETADVIVEQVLDFRQKTDVREIATAARRERVPSVAQGFLWPFAGQAHPQNIAAPFLPNGPYPPAISDRWLNRRIRARVDPERAVAEYLALDIAGAVDLDRLYEMTMDQQRRRDAACGYDIAGLIEARFRDEPLFFSPTHPRLRVIVVLASELFGRLGASRATVARLARALVVPPIMTNEIPIHPGVARHFGLQYWRPADRYRHFHQGFFTAEQFWLRYVRYEWVPELEAGSERFQGGDLDEAERLLRMGLRQAPDSAQGHGIMSRILARRGDLPGAAAEAELAAALAPPGDPEFARHLAQVRALRAGSMQPA